MAFSCSGDYIASGGLDRKLQIFSLADGRLHYSVTIPGPIKSLIWHPGTEQMLFCACNNGVLIDVTIIAGVTMNFNCFRFSNHAIDFMAVSPDPPADYLATGAGADVRIWKRDRRHVWQALGCLSSPNKCAGNLDKDIILTGLHWRAIGNGNIRLISTYRYHGIQLWDVEKVTVVRSIGMRLPILGSSLSPNGLLISTAKLGGYDLYNLDSGIVVHTYTHGFPASNGKFPTTFFPRGIAFCAATADGTVTLWNVEQGDRLQSVQHLPGATIQAIAVHFSEKSGTVFLATASCDDLKVWGATPTGVGRRRKCHNDRYCSKRHTFAVWTAALVCVGAILLVPAFWPTK